MTMWEAKPHMMKIEKREVELLSPKFILRSGSTRKESISTNYSSFFQSRKEAVEFLLKTAEERISSARGLIDSARSRLMWCDKDLQNFKEKEGL